MRAIDYFDKQAEATPDRTAIIDGGVSHSYAGVHAASQRIARAMWAAGLRGEQPAAIYSSNDARVLLCMLGLMRAGAVWVPINYRNALDANVEYLNYVKTSWLFYHSSYRDRIPELQARVPTLQHLICIDAEDGKNPSLERFMQDGADANGEDFNSQDVDWADALGNRDRLVGLVPTGGTTGPAKDAIPCASASPRFRMPQVSSPSPCSHSARRTWSCPASTHSKSCARSNAP